MAVSFVLLLLFVFKGADGSHIVGGRDAAPQSRPYLVSLQVRGQHICGGALVREDFVVTAAHCRVQGTYTVVAGVNSLTSNESTRQQFRAARLIPHPQYDPVRIRNDIMLIQLGDRAQLTEAVQLISLRADRVPAASQCLTAGWGNIDDFNTPPLRLQEVNVTILSTQACRRRWGQVGITSAMICGVGGRNFQGPCSGDSGGPLVCDGATAGVVSFGGQRCGDLRTPAVYTRISSFTEWITTVVCAVEGEAGHSRHPSPKRRFPALPGGSRGIHRPDKIHNPSSEFWVCPGVSSQVDVFGKPPEEVSLEAILNFEN